VSDRRRDLPIDLKPIDFRELAMYRHGSHLAVAYASDNRGMATYTSVYPLLLAPGFPSSSANYGSTGVVSLRDFVSEVAALLTPDESTSEPDAVRRTFLDAADFLTACYQQAGNGQTSLAADWWQHMSAWTEALRSVLPSASPEHIVATTYGAAGLPVPAQGSRFAMRPRDYLEVVRSRWSDAPSIRQELLRLQQIASAEAAATQLSVLDWESETSSILLRTDSPIARVAMAGCTNAAEERRTGWAHLGEEDFRSSYVDAKGKLVVEVDGKPLPRPWDAALPVLRAQQSSDDTYPIVAENFGILIPWKAGVPDGTMSDPATVEIKGLRGSVVDLQVQEQEVRQNGLLLKGALRGSAAAKAPGMLAIEARVHGGYTAYVADRSDCIIAVALPDDALLQIRRVGKKGSGPRNAVALWSLDATPTHMKLGSAGTHELALALGNDFEAEAADLQASTIVFSEGWPGASEAGLITGRGDLSGDVDLSLSTSTLFSFELTVETSRPLSPVVAAATGVLPDYGAPIERTPLGVYDEKMLVALAAAEPGAALGTFIASTSRDGAEFVQITPGVHIESTLRTRHHELYPSLPSAALLSSQEYGALVEAYQDLQLVQHIAALEAEANTSGVTPSRISVEFIPETKLEKLLEAFVGLIKSAKDRSPSDQFWAKHPFSVAVYPSAIGSQSIQAALLSPLHPVRLAWLWRLQVGLRAAHEDGAEPVGALALLDNTLFPFSLAVNNEFDQQIGFAPLPIDGFPGDVFCSWQALVRLVDSRPNVPAKINGDRFPVDGLSALSSAAVSAAIDDFMRVSPHVQALRVDLEAATETRRSSAIDDGVLEKIADLARSSGSFDGVGGIKVSDSPRRKGPRPSFQRISEALALGTAGFNCQWTGRSESSVGEVEPSTNTPHLTFLEGHAATLAVATAPQEPAGWLPKVPLRRFSYRRRLPQAGTAIGYGLSVEHPADQFSASLAAYESAPDGTPFEIRIRPNLAALPEKPNWLVTGDFGVDPQAIAAAATAQSNGRYMLWDWRPASTIRQGSPRQSLRAQPYFIIASVPPALTLAIKTRIEKLNSTIAPGDVDARVRHLVNTLATRAVGLNTLLAIGHHQATGALGFYFALESLVRWMSAADPGEMRLVVPIDAVDPFLRSFPTTTFANRRRADLLAIRATIVGGQTSVVMVPIEIKHYGLNNQEGASTFPSPGEPRFEEHVSQLKSYQEQLITLSSAYVSASAEQVSILGQQLAAILEAAIQLSPKADTNDLSEVMKTVASGEANLCVGKGLLLWYQAGATLEGGLKAGFEETYGPPESRRVDVWIDPAAHDTEYWVSDATPLIENGSHDTVLRALSIAIRPDDLAETEPTGPSGEPDSGEDKQATREPDTAVSAITAQDKDSVEIAEPAGKEPSPEADGSRGMSNADLEARYVRLLAALAEFNVSVQRPANSLPYEEGPAFVQFAVRPAYGVSVGKIESQLENVKLRLGLPADASIGCANHLGNVLLTVPKNDADRYYVTTQTIWSRWKRPPSGFHVPLGEDIKGEVVSIEFSSSNSPHLLIAGVTGSGKSEALLTLLHGAAHFYPPEELELRLVDPKQTEMVSLEKLPHLQRAIGWSAEDAAELLAEAADEMDARYTLFREHRVRDIDELRSKGRQIARVLIVLDEYADLTTDDDERKQIEKQLKRLAQKARAAGIHVIVSTQKPVVQVINTVIKGNLPARVALRVNTASESRIILDEGGAEQLAGKGDAFLKTGNRKVRLQFAQYVAEND
jgi:hypothetical protein